MMKFLRLVLQHFSGIALQRLQQDQKNVFWYLQESGGLNFVRAFLGFVVQP